jgi:hypothetical protein
MAVDKTIKRMNNATIRETVRSGLVVLDRGVFFLISKQGSILQIERTTHKT